MVGLAAPLLLAISTYRAARILTKRKGPLSRLECEQASRNVAESVLCATRLVCSLGASALPKSDPLALD